MRSWTDWNHDGEMHKGQGMMRVCELELLAKVAKGMDGFVVIGCGYGWEFQRTSCPHQLGIDRFLDVYIKDTVYAARNIMEGNEMSALLIEELGEWKDLISGPILWWTDNGYKVAELKGVVMLMKPGDIIGTHDFGTEVSLEWWTEFCTTNGLRDMTEHDEYIDKYFCLQAFAQKV